MHFHWFKLTARQLNQSIKKVTIYVLKPMQFTTTRSSTVSGFNLALLRVTTLPATEETCSDLDEAAGSGKTTLTSLARRGNWDSWCFHHSSDDLWASPLFRLYLQGSLFAMAPSELSPKYLQLWMPVSPEQYCSFGWEAWLLIEGMNVYWLYFNSFSTLSKQ